jgi:hypothetical protein
MLWLHRPGHDLSSDRPTDPISLLTARTGTHEEPWSLRRWLSVQKELTLEEFYAADPQRAAAPEVPYGSLWREFAPVPTYRLAWVPATGELYALELSEPDQAKDPVEVLGVLWSRPQVEACLAGWSERCGGQRSLLWARDRISSWRPLVEEAQVLLAKPDPAH